MTRVVVRQRWRFPDGEIEVRVTTTRALSPAEWVLFGDGPVVAAEEFAAAMTPEEERS